MNLLTSHIIDNISGVLNFNDKTVENLEDQHLKTFIKYVYILNTEKSRITEMDNTLNLEDLFYSEYYWFTKYKNRFFDLYGRDEGLEQQTYKILEKMSIGLENNIDWSIIERIDNGIIDLA